jgi:hypothetical protein
LDKTYQEATNQTDTKQCHTMLWAQQNHKIKNFSMGGIVFWFPKGRKEHIEKFLNWWFGFIKYSIVSPTILYYSSMSINLN